MTMVDERGRVFGRINLVDGTLVAVLLLLVPLAYGTYLLFRPAAPRIDAVEPSAITKEEERISAGGKLVAKFKVKGNGFTPLLRARIGNADALGFVYENPNSADVLVGPVPPGAHDLILLDGVQEVARAKAAIAIQPSSSTTVRAVGVMTNLDQATADAVRVGTALPEGASVFEVIALGPLQPGRRRISVAGSTTMVPAPGTFERAAVLTLKCEPPQGDNPCALGDRIENRSAPVPIALPGASHYFTFLIEELLPTAAPQKVKLVVRLTADSPAVHEGDRDRLLDERAATVTGVSGPNITIEAGADADQNRWRYRGQRLVPGAPFILSTDRYDAHGVVVSIDPTAPRP